MAKKVSIIIPACNEEKYIISCLDSLKKQGYKDIEAVVACNGCTDKTDDIAKKVSQIAPFPIKILSIKERNVSLARNKGAASSTGSILIFLDADTQLTEGTINEIITTNAQIGVCKGRFDSRKLKARLSEKIKNQLWRLVWSNGLIFCSRETFNAIAGFDESKTKGETGDFIKRAKKASNSSLKRANACVITSARRLEKWGYINTAIYWVKERISPSKKDYPLIR